MSDEDSETVRRAAAGDRDAFRALHTAHVRGVHRFLARRVGPDLAEDLTAETFLSAWRALPSYVEQGAPFRAWLLCIARRHILTWSRRRSNTELPVAWLDLQGPGQLEDRVVDQIAAQGVLGAALARLTEAQRTALELRYLQDLSVPETAMVLGLAEPATRQLVHRALRAMVRHMEPIG